MGGEQSSTYPWGVSYTPRMTPTDTKAPATPRGYSATKDQLLNRLRRVEGQVRGVQNMVDEDRYCIDVLTQISAIQAALDKVALGLLDDHARHCIIDGPANLKDDRTEELTAAVARLLLHGCQLGLAQGSDEVRQDGAPCVIRRACKRPGDGPREVVRLGCPRPVLDGVSDLVTRQQAAF
jgi:DNA-binding FrmR family transcriptional regulator